MQAIILCGGLVTRLGNMDNRIPKILLEREFDLNIWFQLEIRKSLQFPPLLNNTLEKNADIQQ